MAKSRFTTSTKGVVDSDKLSIIIITGSYYPKLKVKGPKALLEVSERYTLLNYQIDTLKKLYPESEIIVVVGYNSDLLIKNKHPQSRIVENQLFETTGEIESLRLGINNICRENLLVVMDDVFFEKNAVSGMTKCTSVLLDYNSNKSDNDIGVEIVNNKIISFNYDSPHKWMGLAYIDKSDLKFVKDFCIRNNGNMFVFEAIENIVKVGNNLNIFHTENKIHKL